jgi:hypothetical protein
VRLFQDVNLGGMGVVFVCNSRCIVKVNVASLNLSVMWQASLMEWQEPKRQKRCELTMASDQRLFGACAQTSKQLPIFLPVMCLHQTRARLTTLQTQSCAPLQGTLCSVTNEYE